MRYTKCVTCLPFNLNNTPATTQAVQTVRASLSKLCFWKLVGIDACHAKQSRGDKHATIQNKLLCYCVEGEKDQDETEEVDEEEEDDNSSSFAEDSD